EDDGNAVGDVLFVSERPLDNAGADSLRKIGTACGFREVAVVIREAARAAVQQARNIVHRAELQKVVSEIGGFDTAADRARESVAISDVEIEVMLPNLAAHVEVPGQELP